MRGALRHWIDVPLLDELVDVPAPHVLAQGLVGGIPFLDALLPRVEVVGCRVRDVARQTAVRHDLPNPAAHSVISIRSHRQARGLLRYLDEAVQGVIDIEPHAVVGDADKPGAPKLQAEGGAADDACRYFPATTEKGLLTFLPLKSNAPQVLVAFQDGRAYDDGRGGFGYWMPGRTLEPVRGTIALKDMFINPGGFGAGVAIVVGETTHVVLEDVQNFGGCVQTVGNLNCGITEGLLEVRNCRILGTDASLYCHSMTVEAENLVGGGGEVMFRLVGCRGRIDNAMVTGFVKADYYIKVHAGAVGGPLRISQFCVDNEGFDYVPLKAVVYAEPSLDGGKKGNSLHIAGTLYTGALIKSKAVVELGGPPGPAKGEPSARLLVDGIDLWFPKEKMDTVVLCTSSAWTGEVLAQSEWGDRVRSGLVQFTGPGRCGVTTWQESDAPPTQDAWAEGCNIIRVPQAQDPKTGAWTFKTFRCSRSGVYGTDKEPQWQETKGGAR
jgi:hypothetical protein